jgi:dipeptidyl aminopeptidase/acylaminoacyl peptidase
MSHRFTRHRASVSVLAIVIVAFALTANAQGTRRALQIEDYYRIKTVGAPEMSPDGRWVAFTVSARNEASNDNASEVWLVASDGASQARRVSAAGSNATAPRWNADGQLQFTAAGKAWRLSPTAPEQLVEGDAVAGGRGGRGGGAAATPVLSPDGRAMARLKDTPPPRREPVHESDFAKRHEERFKGVSFDWLDFQRDGQAFPVPNRADPAVSPPQEVFLGDSAGGGERQLSTLGLRPAGLHWKPDGTSLLFTADSGYRNERSYGRTDIWSLGTNGTARRLTTNREYAYANARYSPDGRWILAVRDTPTDLVIARKMNNGGPTDLVVVPAAGGPERVLTADWDYLPAAPVWSPDSRYVYFTGGIGGTTHLFRVAATGGAVEQVTKGQRRLSGISFDKAMTKMAYTVGHFDSLPEIHVAAVDGTGERRLTRIGDDFVRDVALSRVARLQFRSKDGTPVEGWLYYPHCYAPNAGPYPLVVFSHGGPHSAVGPGFDFKLQYFAANGYFVLTTNFRSSTGYGEQFLWATWGAWGTKDGEDVMAGVDHVIASHPIDRARVATVGHSYGGFMSNWLITQYPDRFAAACVGAGIVNWVSDYGTADIAVTKETEFYGPPWDARAREIMMRQSPLIYADKVKAATLFIHGEVDQRVPYSEAEQMYVALKKNGVPARMIQYAGQPHGIAGHWNVVHRMLNERRWLDQYLKPDRPNRATSGTGGR